MMHELAPHANKELRGCCLTGKEGVWRMKRGQRY